MQWLQCKTIEILEILSTSFSISILDPNKQFWSYCGGVQPPQPLRGIHLWQQVLPNLQSKYSILSLGRPLNTGSCSSVVFDWYWSRVVTFFLIILYFEKSSSLSVWSPGRCCVSVFTSFKYWIVWLRELIISEHSLASRDGTLFGIQAFDWSVVINSFRSFVGNFLCQFYKAWFKGIFSLTVVPNLSEKHSF